MKLSVRHGAAITVAVIMVASGMWYCYLIVNQRIEPVLSSWILFFVAAALGLVTYLNNKKSKRSIVTNIANTMDVFVIGGILACLILFGKDVRLGFAWFEFGCLFLAGGILLYYLRYRNAFRAYIAVNGLLIVGYIPTIIRLLTADHNTEPFLLWVSWLVMAMVSLYNPWRDRDFLASLYATRAIVLVVIVLALMIRLEVR